MANNTDIDFANKLRDILTFLFKQTDSPDRKQAYDIGIGLVNARFGACPKCGYVNSGGKFCAECGQQLAGEIIREDNENVESVDYIVGKLGGNQLHIFSISDTKELAMSQLLRKLNMGVSAELFKRTIEKIKPEV